ncbi:MAG TPA: hypothetical protein DCE18_03780 [Syntrophobacteraceae bacterium]|nr:hypothetical protein [Syntrophobacteraceae bacterium]HBZ53801.1 hypothetical protein [Syntrophobacteraceae bacterium]
MGAEGRYLMMETSQVATCTGQTKPYKALNAAYRGYKDGTVEFFGNQVEALTGHSKDDFNSKRLRWTDVIYAADRESVKQSFVLALKGDKTYMREYRVQHRDGSLVWFQEWGQIICDDAGHVESVLGVLLEITERKRMEEIQLRIDRLTGKYLLFMLASEQFAIGIIKVREIIGLTPITPIPGAPDYLRGVINLRGKVIPVVNLRLKLGMEDCPPTDRTCIVLVECRDSQGTRDIGLIVDSVSEVLFVQGQDIDESPDIITRFNGDYITGMAKVAGGIKMVLDVDRLNLGTDLAELDESA